MLERSIALLGIAEDDTFIVVKSLSVTACPDVMSFDKTLTFFILLSCSFCSFCNLFNCINNIAIIDPVINKVTKTPINK